MRRLFNIYILVLLALSVACQRVDLPDNQPIDLPTGAIGSKATITFSTADLTGPETRGILNAEVEVETLHLIVFDENGMLVEVCEAKEHGSSDHDGHGGGKHYSVTLTVTEKPRIIHYVANCPVNQVVYGHETSIIGNMFVDRNNSEGAETVYEVSYWARIEVPYILVEEIEEEQADGTKKKVLSLVDDIKDLFMHVPLLRNYAEITVTQNEDDKTFDVLGFTVYNLLNRGTVAPYNSNTQQFQSFFEYKNGEITKYLYPKMYKEFNYEGHALTSAKLITDLVTVKENGEDKVKEFKMGEPFYVYERKVSVMTDEEEKWRESPPHIIIKARYSDDGDAVKDTDPIYYYKMDLVYTEKDEHGSEEVKYYNILRNFMYDFNITAIHDVGYDSWEKAVAGAAGNNISGSSTTSKLTNISDNKGRLWVSYTDITLVTGNDVTFRYKYIPNYYGIEGSKYAKNEVQNDLVTFSNIKGDVITGIDIATNDASDEWREVTIHVKEPSDISQQQILYLKTNNSNLNRQIRHTLRKKLTMEVECTPKVRNSILQPMTVDIKLPTGLTEDMFPLVLNMETYDRTLSPDATKNSIPVTAGPSIVEGRVGESSYYYTVTITTFDAYKALTNRTFSTYWRTNKADNASTFYVDNKYFNLASGSWQNYQYLFSNASCTTSALGVDQNVTISFEMADGAINKPVTISLEGMTYNGETVMTYTPSSKNVSISGFKTTTDADPVSFTLDADDYNILGPIEGDRQTYKFGGAFVGVTSLKLEADVEVDFTFNISADALNALKSLYPEAGDAGVPMFVTLDRMHPADDQLVYSQIRAEGDRYIYRINQSGKQTIKLATTEAVDGICSVTLQADYFDTQTVTIQQTDTTVSAQFDRWEDTLNSSVNNTTERSGLPAGTVIVGEKIYYYVTVSADTKPTSVTIDSKDAGEPVSQDESSYTYRIEWSKSENRVYSMSANVIVAGTTYNVSLGDIKVAGLKEGNITTASQLGTPAGTFYVFKNRSTSSYMTSEGNPAVNESMSYYSLFTINNNKIVSVATNQQLKSSNSYNSTTTSFDAAGTDYTFAAQNNNYVRISYTYTSWNNTTTYYIRQQNNSDTVQSSTSTNNYRSDWQVYKVTYVIPE